MQSVFTREDMRVKHNADLEVFFIFKPAIFAIVFQERRAFNLRIC